MSDVRVRFAPSPTGYLHIGGARTALFNWLFARHEGGAFVLRIEDTDQARKVEGAVQAIYDGLNWLGLGWDEGPDKGGQHGPYVQSERLDIYRNHVDALIEGGHAYRCFCTADRLAELRETQRLAKQQPGYDRRCRNLSQEEMDEQLAGGSPYVVRLKIPLSGETRFDDVVRGVVVNENRNLDDFVLLKSDGFPTYHLANVVDDHLMEISHVIRGEEWIPSTPKHVLIYEALGWGEHLPVFCHVPSILAPGGGKLSKRKGAAAVTDFEAMGFVPEAVRNFISLLGWSPGDDREKMPLEDIIEAFTLDRIQARGAVFDEKKLEWLNGEYITEYSAEQLYDLAVPAWVDAGLVTAEEATERREYLLAVIELFKSRMNRIGDFVELAGYCFGEPEECDAKARKKHWKAEEVPARVRTAAERFEALESFSEAATEDAVRALAEEEDVSAAKFIHPIRLAVSGLSFGPGLFELLELLGQETVVRRLRRAAEVMEQDRG